MFSPSNLFKPDPAVENVAVVDRRDAPASLQEMLRARLPRVIVTPAILAVIVAIFVVMVVVSGEVVFSSKTLVRWGAQFGPGVADGQWWRLLSAMWLHAHPLHLALNAIFLWRFGDYVERLLGPVVFLIVYVLAGVVASAVSLQFHGLSVGASGAIFGLVGVLLTVAMTSRGRGGLGEMVAELRPNLISIVVANLFLGFLMQGVDNAAHIGGLAGGLVLGWLVGRHSLDATPSPRLTADPDRHDRRHRGRGGPLRRRAGRMSAPRWPASASQIDRAEAAFRVARRGHRGRAANAGGRGRRGRDGPCSPSSTTRKVAPTILLRAAMAQVSAVGSRSGWAHRGQQGPAWRPRRDGRQTHRWAVCLAPVRRCLAATRGRAARRRCGRRRRRRCAGRGHDSRRLENPRGELTTEDAVHA